VQQRLNPRKLGAKIKNNHFLVFGKNPLLQLTGSEFTLSKLRQNTKQFYTSSNLVSLKSLSIQLNQSRQPPHKSPKNRIQLSFLRMRIKRSHIPSLIREILRPNPNPALQFSQDIVNLTRPKKSLNKAIPGPGNANLTGSQIKLHDLVILQLCQLNHIISQAVEVMNSAIQILSNRKRLSPLIPSNNMLGMVKSQILQPIERIRAIKLATALRPAGFKRLPIVIHVASSWLN